MCGPAIVYTVCQSNYYFIVSGGSNESLIPDRALFLLPAMSTGHQHKHHKPITIYTFLTSLEERLNKYCKRAFHRSKEPFF